MGWDHTHSRDPFAQPHGTIAPVTYPTGSLRIANFRLFSSSLDNWNSKRYQRLQTWQILRVRVVLEPAEALNPRLHYYCLLHTFWFHSLSFRSLTVHLCTVFISKCGLFSLITSTSVCGGLHESSRKNNNCKYKFCITSNRQGCRQRILVEISNKAQRRWITSITLVFNCL